MNRMARFHKATGDTLRMAQWAAFAAALYVVTFDLGLQESHPGLQATAYNLANLTIRAWIGYWIARNTLGRLDLGGTSPPLHYVARALIILGALVAPR